MSRAVRTGFTVIELTLVVAITGLIAVSILVSIGIALKNQRYMDATDQTVDYFEGIYDQVMNVANDRDDNLICNSAGGVQSGSGMARGMSNCTLVGYLVRSQDGSKITSNAVIARYDVRNEPGIETRSEEQILESSGLALLDQSELHYNLDWGTSLIPAQFTMMVVRVPVSGLIRTFVTDNGLSMPNDPELRRSPVAAEGKKFCLQPEGLFSGSGSPNGFILSQNAANSSGVNKITTGDCAL